MSQPKKLNTLVFGRLLKLSTSYKTYLFLAFITTLILAVLSPSRVMVMGEMVDKYIAKGQNAQLLLVWTLVIVGLLILESALQFLASYYSNLLAQSIMYGIRTKLFKHLTTFRMKYFDKNSIGGLVTRLVSDMEAISEVFSAGLMNFAGDVLMLSITLGWMFYADWELALYVLIPIPILLFATRIFARAMRKSFQLESTQVGKLNSFVQERLTGMNLVQLFNRQKKEYQQFQEINAGHREAHIKAIWANSIFFPFVELLSSLSVAFLYVIVVMNIQNGGAIDMKSEFAEVTLFTFWIQMLFRPIRQLADKFNVLQRGSVRAERVFETLDLKDQIQNTGTITNCDFGGDIKFTDVSFAYNDEDWVLKNINLTIPSGSSIAFVGATGAGKSSIVNLIGRFYEYQKGQITIDGNDINEFEINYLRRNVAIVLQDVFLFSDTILNNITLRDSSITKDQVIEAAKAVGAHDFIMRLPGDYNYQVGERGSVLSVGQRQLLSFIRAYVYNPQILILDEATSSVDNESEEMIQRATDKLTEGRTSILIAHRLSTIQKADKIVVLEKGEIIEEGSHSQLLDGNGHYKKLFDMQFGKEAQG